MKRVVEARLIGLTSTLTARADEPLVSGRVEMREIPYVRQPADFSAPVRYAHGPDSDLQPDAPQGTILEGRHRALRKINAPTSCRKRSRE
jgi:hypothetical protein